FSMSLDAYDIDIKDAIGQLGVQQIADRCEQGATQLCGFVQRDSAGQINTIYNLFINIDRAKTRGIDFETTYRRGVEWFGGGERVTVRLLTSYVDELSQTVSGNTQDRSGQTGLTGGAPDWQANLSLGYERGGFSGTLQGRYINAGLYDATWRTGVEIDDNTIDSFFLTNLQLAYQQDLANGMNWRVSLNVNNLLDADPPLVASFGFTGSQATNSGLFDIYGRRYTLGVRLKF
ncbi:MAG: TonB-dependent receptor, partial [Proteobacteria bacterium]